MRKWSQDVFSTTKRGSSNARIFDTGEKNVQRQHMGLLYMLSGLQRKSIEILVLCKESKIGIFVFKDINTYSSVNLLLKPNLKKIANCLV